MLKTFTKLFTLLVCMCAFTFVNAQGLPITFEDPNITYEVIGFGGADFGPIPAEVIANPDPSGENTSATVASITKPEGAQTWAGCTFVMSEVIDFSATTTLKFRIWSPRAGVPVLLKIEDTTSPPDGNGNPSIFAEVQGFTVLAQTWETVTIDMSVYPDFSTMNSYNQVIVFPDFGNVGVAGGETYYVDDIRNASTVSIDETELAKVQMTAFPNPASDLLNVQFDIPVSGVVTMTMVDVLGRTAASTYLGNVPAGAYTESVDVNALSSGNYVLVLRLDEQIIKTQTIAVN